MREHIKVGSLVNVQQDALCIAKSYHAFILDESCMGIVVARKRIQGERVFAYIVFVNEFNCMRTYGEYIDVIQE